MTGIDAVCFPHIVDSILDILCNNEPLTAANLQAVCRTWHTKIKTRLFTHVWISYDCDDRGESFSIGTISIRPTPSIRFTVSLVNHTSGREGVWSPVNVAPYNLVRIGSHPVVLATLRAARVLDIRRIAVRGLPRLKWGLSTLQMIRSEFEYDGGMTTALSSSAETVAFFNRQEGGADYALTRISMSDILAEKLVIHPFKELLVDYQRGVFDNLPDTLQNVTAFYPFRPTLGRRRGFDQATYDLFTDVVIETIDSHFSNNTRTLTLVSPDVSSPLDHQLPNPFEASWARLESRLRGRDPHLLANVEFLTASEYRERVGEETFRLHTCMAM